MTQPTPEPPKRPAIPITSAALSFTLRTPRLTRLPPPPPPSPSLRPKHERPSTPLRAFPAPLPHPITPQPPHSTPSSLSHNDHLPDPPPPIHPLRPPQTPLPPRTKIPPNQIFQTLDTFSPFAYRSQVRPTVPSTLKRLSELTSPNAHSPLKRVRGEGDGVTLSALTPSRFHPIGSLVGVKREDEEDVGVSPRGRRVVKWSGKGPPPVSIQLSNLLSSSSSSIQLFYTSFHAKLRPLRTRPSPTPKSLIHTAPLILSIHPHSTVPGPTHYSTLVRCAIQRSPRGMKIMDHSPIKDHWQNAIPQKKDPNDVDQIGEIRKSAFTGQLENLKEDKGEHEGSNTEEEEVEKMVLVLFQTLPSGCSHLGVDPRVLKEQQKNWLVGIWAWTEVLISLPSPLSLSSNPTNMMTDTRPATPTSTALNEPHKDTQYQEKMYDSSLKEGEASNQAEREEQEVDMSMRSDQVSEKVWKEENVIVASRYMIIQD
ncbi:hypothetical protein M231_07064 [Tremella mesenterica]|uniref:Uncharacterized protein n=1 Tax=Tremella mesenterica TaxID=5217 RepID=A0A4Q1BFW4_TREME|nr:hypothetical protein M231_07064 [Tremella mesenterica]